MASPVARTAHDPVGAPSRPDWILFRRPHDERGLTMIPTIGVPVRYFPFLGRETNVGNGVVPPPEAKGCSAVDRMDCPSRQVGEHSAVDARVVADPSDGW